MMRAGFIRPDCKGMLLRAAAGGDIRLLNDYSAIRK